MVTWALSASHPRTCSTGQDQHAPLAALLGCGCHLLNLNELACLRIGWLLQRCMGYLLQQSQHQQGTHAQFSDTAAWWWSPACRPMCLCSSMLILYLRLTDLHLTDMCVLLPAAVGSCQSCAQCSSCVPVTTPRVCLLLPSSSTTLVHSSGSTLDHGRWAQPGPHYNIIVCQLGPHRVCNHHVSQFSSVVMGMGCP